MTGFIVVGPERTGLLYTPEDLEFMATMGQQATASIVTVRLSEDPARTREFGAAGSFAQAYNAQAAVDACGQVIIACGVTPSAQRRRAAGPMLGRIVATTSRRPATLMADAGFFSEANRVAAEQAGVDVYIPPDRDAHGHALAAGRRHPARAGHASARMRDKLRTAEVEALYRRRKAIIEPVFVYINAIRGFRRFSMRGLDKVRASRLRCPDDSAVVEKTPLSICTSPSSSRWTRESHARIQIWDGEGVNTVPSLSPLG